MEVTELIMYFQLGINFSWLVNLLAGLLEELVPSSLNQQLTTCQVNGEHSRLLCSPYLCLKCLILQKIAIIMRFCGFTALSLHCWCRCSLSKQPDVHCYHLSHLRGDFQNKESICLSNSGQRLSPAPPGSGGPSLKSLCAPSRPYKRIRFSTFSAQSRL